MLVSTLAPTCEPHTRDWIEYATAFAPFLAATIAVTIGAVQVYLQRQNLKKDLFDKRFAVYLGLKQYLATMTSGPFDLQESTLESLRVAYRPAQFLFGAEVVGLIYDIEREVDRIYNDFERLTLAAKSDPTVKLVTPIDQPDRFSEFAEKVDQVLPRYLQLYHEQTPAVRFVAAVNRWMNESAATLSKRYERVDG